MDLVQVHTNFEIGRRIVEQEQKGKGRAAYGEEVIDALAERLTAEFGRGFSSSSLAYMRSFFLLYQDRAKILQSVIGKSGVQKNLQSAIGKSALAQSRPFTLSWTHYIFLLGIKNPDERSFYEIEASITLPKGARIHAREYQLYLPSKEVLQKKLVEWAGKAGDA